MYRDEHVIINYVVCDKCGKRTEIGRNLSWEGQFNNSIAAFYETKIVDGKVTNVCRDCT